MKANNRSSAAWVLLIVLAASVFAIQSYLTYRIYTSHFPGANDFLGRWASGCSLLWYGENPYSESATLRSQIYMHGRPAEPGEDHAPFFYPLYALAFIAPLCATKNYAVVQAIWMTLMLYVMIIGTVISIRASRWRPSPLLGGVTLAWSILNYPHARAVLLGQFNLIVFLSVGLTLLLLGQESDLAAGAVLAMATVKPQVSFLVIPWLLWWTANQKRFRFWRGFAVTIAIAIGVSLLIVPTWPRDFINQVREYDSLAGTPYHSLSWIVTRFLLGFGPVAEALVTALAGIGVLVVAWRFRRSRGDTMLWATAMVLLLSNFIASRVATTAYPVLLFALFLLFRLWSDRWHSQWPVLVTQIALLVGQWAIFLLTLDGNFETAAVYLPFPFFMLIALLVTRTSSASAPAAAKAEADLAIHGGGR